VDFKTGGDWPTLAKGGGSSMELINPWMDNSLSSAWRDSDESAKSKMRQYACTGTYEELHVKGAPTDYKELHFHLVGDSHIALDNIYLGKIARPLTPALSPGGGEGVAASSPSPRPGERAGVRGQSVLGGTN